MKKREKLAIPLPEAIDGKRWQIHRSPNMRTAGVSTKGEQMIVPLGDSEVERLVRLHEMTHVKITPDVEIEEALNELPESILNLCEDARVHKQMKRLRFPLGKMRGVISDMEIKQIAEQAHPAELAGVALAMYGTGELERLEEMLPNKERESIFAYGVALAENAVFAFSHLVPFETTVSLTKEIVEALGDPRVPEQPQPTAISPTQLPRLAGFERDRNGIPTKFKPGAPPPNTNDQPHGEGGWMRMVFEEPPLSVKLPGWMKGRRKKVPDQRGRRLHRIGRLYKDGRVFAHRPPVKGGGAVLIDTSNSMRLTPQEVLQLCIAYPGGVIGAYSSSSHVGRESYGTLRVIARNGKRVPDDQISPPGGGNGVDGPALDWLAKQPGPRYWISDAGVYGGAEGLRYCEQVCRRANIKRVDNAWQIVGKVTS